MWLVDIPKNVIINETEDHSMNEELLNNILDAVKGVNTRLYKIDAKVDSLETQDRSVKLTIENEIRPNIAEIASCHLDLSKKLDAVTTL